MAKKKVVFFDLGDTLASTEPPFIHRIAQSMRKAGFGISDRELEEAYVAADYELYLKHKSEGGINPEQHRAWFLPLLYGAVSPPGNIDEFRSRVREEMSALRFTRAALPGAVELLERLKGEGYRLAVISNNDGYTVEKCEEVGIKDYFEHIFDSTLLNLIKPDPRIFEYAAERCGVSPYEAVHVGDMFGSDVMGGRDAGLDVVWFNARNAPRPDVPRVREAGSLAEVADLIG